MKSIKKSLKEGVDFTVKYIPNGAYIVSHNTEASIKSSKKFYNYISSLGRELSTKINLSKSSS